MVFIVSPMRVHTRRRYWSSIATRLHVAPNPDSVVLVCQRSSHNARKQAKKTDNDASGMARFRLFCEAQVCVARSPRKRAAGASS